MVDDDMLLPENWLQLVTKAIEPNVGAIGTVAVHKNPHAAAYERVVGTVYNLSKLDTNPHINNILIRRKLMENYNPPKLFFGEDQYFKRYVQKTGYRWKVLALFGCNPFGDFKELRYHWYLVSAVWTFWSLQACTENGCKIHFHPVCCSIKVECCDVLVLD